MEICADVIKTLSISQLLKRTGWTHLELENILEAAEEGKFGLYFKPSKLIGPMGQKSAFVLKTSIKGLLRSVSISKKEKHNYQKLAAKYIKFCKTYKRFLIPREGYVRLPTKTETEILIACQSSTVTRLKIESKIVGTEWCNHFGFTLKKERGIFLVVSPVYYFPGKYIEPEDLLVFIDQIELFEKTYVTNNDNNNTSIILKSHNDQPKKARTTALIEEIGKAYHSSEKKDAKSIWETLQENAIHGDSVIDEMSNWSDRDPKITWLSGSHYRTLRRRSFENRVSKIKKATL